MRIFYLLLLVVSFTLGIVSAFAVAYYTFDAKPVEVVDQGPTVKILVAKREIPVGAEIHAEDVIYADVPVSGIPSKAITNFMEVYRRRSAYPITAGCPICEDLLMLKTVSESEEARFLPAGSRIVTLEISSLRQGHVVAEPNVSLANILQPGRKIDVRVLPSEGPQGEMIERKRAVIDSFADSSPDREIGEIVLEDIAIHDVHGQAGTRGGKQLQAFSLILDEEESARLTEAAKAGRLRVTLRKDESQKAELQADHAPPVESIARSNPAEATPAPKSPQSSPEASVALRFEPKTAAPSAPEARQTETEPLRAERSNVSRVSFVPPQHLTDRSPASTPRNDEPARTREAAGIVFQATPSVASPRTEPRVFTVGSTVPVGPSGLESGVYSPFTRTPAPASDDIVEPQKPTVPPRLQGERFFPDRKR